VLPWGEDDGGIDLLASTNCSKIGQVLIFTGLQNFLKNFLESLPIIPSDGPVPERGLCKDLFTFPVCLNDGYFDVSIVGDGNR
jgi:hypothetical protein